MQSITTHYHGSMSTPVGDLLITSTAQHITGIAFVWSTDNQLLHQVPSHSQDNSLVQLAIQQLAQYFAGQRQQFHLPLQIEGTEFRQQVWRQLTQIPFGQTVSYTDITEAIGRKGAVRAVGSANGANPLAIVVPCHRVIGKNGTLTGYRGGLSRKEWLLNHELKLSS